MLRPHPWLFGRGTHILKPGCTWESLGELTKVLSSGSFPRDSDFTGPSVLWTLTFFKAPSWFWYIARLEDGCFIYSISSSREARLQTSWERKQPPGTWHLLSEARLKLISLTNSIVSHIMTLRFPQSLMKAQAPGHSIFILLKLTQSPILSLLHHTL